METYGSSAEENKLVIPSTFEEILNFTVRAIGEDFPTSREWHAFEAKNFSNNHHNSPYIHRLEEWSVKEISRNCRHFKLLAEKFSKADNKPLEEIFSYLSKNFNGDPNRAFDLAFTIAEKRKKLGTPFNCVSPFEAEKYMFLLTVWPAVKLLHNSFLRVKNYQPLKEDEFRTKLLKLHNKDENFPHNLYQLEYVVWFIKNHVIFEGKFDKGAASDPITK